MNAKEIENLYQRALASPGRRDCKPGKSNADFSYRERKEYEKAQELIDTLPDASFVDKNTSADQYLIAQKKYEDAGRLAEQQMTKMIGGCLWDALTLMEHHEGRAYRRCQKKDWRNL